MKTRQHNQAHQPEPRLPQPSEERSTDALPAALTFFVTRGQRGAICAALQRIDHDRNAALLTALNLSDTTGGRRRDG